MTNRTTLIMALALTLLAACGRPQKGDSGSNGSSGAPGAKGQDGVDGQDGQDGSQGPQGPAGTPGTQITVVKLCGGTTAYPGTFVEVAFCVGTKLYAVYSANGGFESEIPPGTYSSNGINSSCTFTVGANCAVSY